MFLFLDHVMWKIHPACKSDNNTYDAVEMMTKTEDTFTFLKSLKLRSSKHYWKSKNYKCWNLAFVVNLPKKAETFVNALFLLTSQDLISTLELRGKHTSISISDTRLTLFASIAVMNSKYFLVCVLFLRVDSLQGKVINEKVLQLSQLTKCTYDYEVSVHTARGAKSTLSDDYQVHALVRCSSVTLLTTNNRLLQAFY